MWNTVLFDLDGTLTDSGEGITRCVQYALRKEFDIQVDNLHDLDPFVGPPLKEQFMEFANLTEEQAERAIRAYRERYRTRGIYENRLYDGIADVLAELSEAGMILAVASSKPTEFCREILRYFGVEHFFRVIVGSEMNGARTRKSEVIGEVLRQLGMSGMRQNVVLVGDRKYDVEGAKEAGICSIGVSYGYGSREELERAWPDCIVDTTEELRNVLIGQLQDGMSRSEMYNGSTLPKLSRYENPEDERYRFTPQGYYPAQIQNYPPQGYSSPPRHYDGLERPSGRGESVLYKIWRIVYPLLLDYGVTVIVTNLALAILISGYGIEYLREYQRHSITILGITDAVITVFCFLLFKGDEKKRMREGRTDRLLRLNSVTVFQMIAVILFTCGLSAVINMVTAYLPIKSDVYSQLEQSILAANPLVQILVICIIGPVAEELLFRGIIYRRLRDYTGTAWAAVLSGILFGVIHGNLTQGIYAGTFGVVLALIYEHYGTLWVVITAHVLNNLLASFGDPLMSMLSIAGQYVYSGVMILCVCVFGWYIFGKHRKVNRA